MSEKLTTSQIIDALVCTTRPFSERTKDKCGACRYGLWKEHFETLYCFWDAICRDAAQRLIELNDLGYEMSDEEKLPTSLIIDALICTSRPSNKRAKWYECRDCYYGILHEFFKDWNCCREDLFKNAAERLIELIGAEMIER